MSTIKATYLQHPSSSSANLTLASDGTVSGGSGLGGLVHLHTESMTSDSSLSIDNVFDSTYDFYRIHVRATGSSTNLQLRCRTRLSGADDTASVYYTSSYYIGTTGAGAGSTVGVITNVGWEILNATDPADTNSQGYFDLAYPLSNKRKQGSGLFSQQNPSSVGYGQIRWMNKTNTTNFDGLTFFTNTGTITAEFSIYGYANS